MQWAAPWMRSKALWGLVGLCLAAALGWALWQRGHRPSPSLRIALLPVVAQEGMAQEEAEALRRLFADYVEFHGRASVLLLLAELPSPQDAQVLREVLLVRLHPGRRGDLLDLGLSAVTGEAFLRGRTAAPPPSRFQAHLDALSAAYREIPLGLPRDEPALGLMPQDPGHFWTMVRVRALPKTLSSVQEGIHLMEDVCQKDTFSIQPRALLGRLYMERVYMGAEHGRYDPARALEQFRSVQARAYTHGDMTSNHVGVLLESGSVKEAIALAYRGIQENPDSPRALLATTYALRVGGLLSSAQKVAARLNRIQRLLGSGLLPDQALLYAMDLDEYERMVAQGIAQSQGNRAQLYVEQAHIDHLRGRREAALQSYRLAASEARKMETLLAARRIADIHVAVLEGKHEVGRRLLMEHRSALRASRMPDSEEILRLSEAACLLGERDVGMELVEFAFSTGFSALHWYDENPLLALARTSPRWPAFRMHAQDRHQALAAAFPPEMWSFLDP